MFSTIEEKLIIGVLVTAALTGLYFKIYESGKSAGYQVGQVAQLDTDKKTFEQQRGELVSSLTAAQQAVTQSATQVRTLQLSQSTLLAALSATGIKQVPAASPGAPPIIAAPPVPETCVQAFAQVPLLVQDVNNLEQQVAALQTEQKDTAQERDSLITSYNIVVGDYVKAYNAAQPHHNLAIRILSFGLVRNKKLNLPDPLSLPEVPLVHVSTNRGSTANVSPSNGVRLQP